MKRIAIIGAGQWGPNLIRNFHNKQTSTVATVVDQSEAKLRQVRAHFPDVHLSMRAEDALADPGVEAVVIATPTSTHYALAKAALDAGKHVLVEKPITTSAREGDELGDLAARRGLVLMVGHVFIYNAAVQRVRSYIEDGHLGHLYYISMTRTNLGPIRRDVNAAWDLAAHDISMVNYWLRAMPTSVSASGKSWINSGIEDAVFAILRYPGEVLIQLHCSWLHPRKSREVVVIGDKRMLVFDDLNLTEPIRIYESSVADDRSEFVDSFASYRMAVREGDIVIPRISTVEPLRAECDHFLECIDRGLPPLTGAPEGVAVVRSLEAIERSLRNGGRQECVDGA